MIYAHFMTSEGNFTKSHRHPESIDKIVIPALNAQKTNQAQIDAAKLNRVKSAIFLTVVSPEFQVQR